MRHRHHYAFVKPMREKTVEKSKIIITLFVIIDGECDDERVPSLIDGERHPEVRRMIAVVTGRGHDGPSGLLVQYIGAGLL